MSAVNFLCPCCGFQPVYDREIAVRISEIIKTYFQKKTAERKEYNRKNPDKMLESYAFTELANIKGFTVYFIRRMTGEQFKRISENFKDLRASNAGTLYTRYEEYISRNPKYKTFADELAPLIIEDLKNHLLTSNK